MLDSASEKAQANAAASLCNVSSLAGCKTRIIEAGALQALSSMTTTSSSGDVRSASQRALDAVTSLLTPNSRRIVLGSQSARLEEATRKLRMPGAPGAASAAKSLGRLASPLGRSSSFSSVEGASASGYQRRSWRSPLGSHATPIRAGPFATMPGAGRVAPRSADSSTPSPAAGPNGGRSGLGGGLDSTLDGLEACLAAPEDRAEPSITRSVSLPTSCHQTGHQSPSSYQGVPQGVAQGVPQGVTQGVAQGVAQGLSGHLSPSGHLGLPGSQSPRSGQLSPGSPTRLETIAGSPTASPAAVRGPAAASATPEVPEEAKGPQAPAVD